MASRLQHENWPGGRHAFIKCIFSMFRRPVSASENMIRPGIDEWWRQGGDSVIRRKGVPRACFIQGENLEMIEFLHQSIESGEYPLGLLEIYFIEKLIAHIHWCRLGFNPYHLIICCGLLSTPPWQVGSQITLQQADLYLCLDGAEIRWHYLKPDRRISAKLGRLGVSYHQAPMRDILNSNNSIEVGRWFNSFSLLFQPL